jgi:cytochrome P450
LPVQTMDQIRNYFDIPTPALASAFVLLFIYAFLIHPVFFGPYSHVPGPVLAKISGLYMVWHDFWLQRPQKIAALHQEYGPIICTGPGEVSFASSDLMREIYGNSGRYSKSSIFQIFKLYGERPLFALLKHSDHRKKRSFTASFYQKSSITKPDMEVFVRENAHRCLECIDEGLSVDPAGSSGQARKSGTVDAYPLINRMAYDNVTRALYGSRYCSKALVTNSEDRQLLMGIKQSQKWCSLVFNFPVLASFASWVSKTFPRGISSLVLPQSLNHAFTSDRRWAKVGWDRFHSALADLDSVEENTLMKRLLASQDKAGDELTTKFIAAELHDNGVAGQETMAVASSYQFFFLGKNQEWQRRVREELAALPRAEDGFPHLADIDSAPLLEASIRESLRVRPNASGRSERIIVDAQKSYDGIRLPVGTRVTASTLFLHKVPEIFPDPEKFLPERWLDQSPEAMQRLERYYLPFGYGARICIGKALALMEMKLLITFILLKYRVDVPPEMGDAVTGPMRQSGSMDAVPIGMKCDLTFTEL